ncbi:hypothetical protein BT93_C1063 [Corymbia citriodora subsp. variegata]|nr:hypothetical protein BT93_C1063 [Corymbia citriodora subsp. variegata]
MIYASAHLSSQWDFLAMTMTICSSDALFRLSSMQVFVFCHILKFLIILVFMISELQIEMSFRIWEQNHLFIRKKLMIFYKFEQYYLYESCWNYEKKHFHNFIHFMRSSNIL